MTSATRKKITAGFLRGRDGQDLGQQIEQVAVGCAYVSIPDHVNARKVFMYPN